MPKVDRRLVAISGIGSAFGLAIARRFLSAGANVHGCDCDPAGLAEAAALGCHVAEVDLVDRPAARAWIARVEHDAGRAIDVLVNNAGGVAGQSHQRFDRVSDADWDTVIAVNLGAAMALSQAALGGMTRAGRGAIVNIASGAALRASMTGIQAYATAKHALLGLTRQLAHEFGPHGIRVNAVAPGLVITNAATQQQWQGYGDAGQDAILGGIALRRLGTPDDIARAVSFLASDDADFITGEILSVDGGR
ncbi:SDR family NAD(P)-dependent oxidoreductase [Sphingomonas hylomeconis]|uniref:SDR family NAD(P)-dependent oxidoreductase n=1 Tax=Sphingomonas hylomeconis TaxID=1395958 RepID=A0ABV7SWU1_9SPHN|nr:SDR family oxidoreductase [Sphingomonas hylomeconis]